MRRTLALTVVRVGAWAAVAAAADGGPAPGLDYGNGIVAPGGKIRYLALSNGRKTLLEAIVIGSGKLHGARSLKGALGIPLVTYGGDTGGLSRDGRRLVLSTWPGQPVTRFVVIDPRSFRTKGHVRLRGRFAFDALSPDGSLMYLIQFLGSPNAASQPYAVRAFSWKTQTLLPGSIVDRREPDEKMTGLPVKRAGTASARSSMRSTPCTVARSASIFPGSDRHAGSTRSSCASAAGCSSSGARARRSRGSTGRR